MANWMTRYRENISGRYYVDRSCIGCELCGEISPGNFSPNTDLEHPDAYYYVSRQPGTDEEENLCAEAMDMCPVNAIGNDGKCR